MFFFNFFNTPEDMPKKVNAEEIYQALTDEFNIVGATGELQFRINDYTIVVEQNNVIGNLIEEWLAKWLNSKGFANIYNHKQESPDFWLDPDDLNKDWLEIKCFTGSANFDINNFTSYINEIKVKPYKLHSKYLIFKYFMKDGVVTIENCWLKNVWEISSPSEKYPVKNQNKRGVIYNLRPSTWYSEKGDYPSFTCLEHFLAAMEQTIYKYGPTNSMADGWLDTVLTNYKKFYGKDLVVPRWIDIKSQYQKR